MNEKVGPIDPHFIKCWAHKLLTLTKFGSPTNSKLHLPKSMTSKPPTNNKKV